MFSWKNSTPYIISSVLKFNLAFRLSLNILISLSSKYNWRAISFALTSRLIFQFFFPYSSQSCINNLFSCIFRMDSTLFVYYIEWSIFFSSNSSFFAFFSKLALANSNFNSFSSTFFKGLWVSLNVGPSTPYSLWILGSLTTKS